MLKQKVLILNEKNWADSLACLRYGKRIPVSKAHGLGQVDGSFMGLKCQPDLKKSFVTREWNVVWYLPTHSRNRFDQLCGFHLERVCKLHDIQQSDVALAALDSTDVVSMQVGQFRELLLRKSAFDSQFAQPFTQ